MTNTGQPQPIEERLSRLESLFANVGETVLAHDGTIDVLVANINQLTENVNTLNNNVDSLTLTVNRTQAQIDNLTIAVDRSTTNIEALTTQAAEDRQLAAIDRQEFRQDIRQIWEYLRDRNGGSSPPAPGGES